jgi:hypothetical protein
MQLAHDGLTLWYGTPDAPAPLDSEEDRSQLSVTVGAMPSNPSNTVSVRYRVDGGPVQTVHARRTQTDFSRRADYFQASLPNIWSGDTVTYLPILTCAGRRAPDPQTAATFPSSFRLATPMHPPKLPQPVTQDWEPGRERLPYTLEYLASIRIPLKGPELIGETPEGIKVNWFWYPSEGIVVGPKLSAKVRQLGGDWMTVRRDGIGVMDVRATLETNDGALLYVTYPGYFELGENGYQDFLNRRYPNRAPTRTTPRFSVAHPRYRWLNRVQCLGIGEVRLDELVYIYDLYAVR